MRNRKRDKQKRRLGKEAWRKLLAEQLAEKERIAEKRRRIEASLMSLAVDLGILRGPGQ